MRVLANRLVAHERRENGPSDSKPPAPFHVCEKLRPSLATLMGNAGFQALLSRAVVLARPEAPWLSPIHSITKEPCAALEKQEAQIGPEEIAKGSVVLLAQLLGLLETFIGENLTRQLVRDVWPKLPSTNTEFRKNVENEKKK